MVVVVGLSVADRVKERELRHMVLEEKRRTRALIEEEEVEDS